MPNKPHLEFKRVALKEDPISQSTCFRCQVHGPINTRVTVASRMKPSLMYWRIVSVLILS